jgi:hypothetical protein
VYAPNGRVANKSQTTFFGAIFANNFQSGGSITFHYDKAATAESQACPPPTGGCNSCLDCANQACNSGVCGGCTNDGQCCAPLRCKDNICQFTSY